MQSGREAQQSISLTTYLNSEREAQQSQLEQLLWNQKRKLNNHTSDSIFAFRMRSSTRYNSSKVLEIREGSSTRHLEQPIPPRGQKHPRAPAVRPGSPPRSSTTPGTTHLHRTLCCAAPESFPQPIQPIPRVGLLNLPARKPASPNASKLPDRTAGSRGCFSPTETVRRCGKKGKHVNHKTHVLYDVCFNMIFPFSPSGNGGGGGKKGNT